MSPPRTRRGFLGRMAELVGVRRARRRKPIGLDRLRHADGVSFGRSPTLRDIEWLARKSGVRSLLNLNTEGETGEHLSPNVEASWAHAFAMQHERVSIDVGVLRSEWVDRFLAQLERMDRPVYVHSLRGQRAKAFVAIQLALQRGQSGAQALAAARAEGLGDASQVLADFVVDEVDQRSPAKV